MVFSSQATHVRLTRTSSDLRALSAILLPPSPILQADDLLISSTSGEVPILLEDTRHVRDSRLSMCGVATDLDVIGKLAANVGNTRHLAGNGEALLDDENWTRGKPDDTCIPPTHSCHSVIHDDALRVGGDAGRSSPPGNCSTPVSIQQAWFEGSQDPQASSPSPVELSTATVTHKEDLDVEQLLMMATFRTYATLPTPTFAPPSPSSSTDVISPLSSPVGRRHRRPLERARAVRFPGRPKSPRLQANEAEMNVVRNAPPSTNLASCPRWQSAGTVLPYVVDIRASDVAHPFMKRVAVPEEFPWIKRVAIELWIDQEGFRAVKSCMQLMGYSPRTRSLHPYESTENIGSDLTGGVAEFMPTKRETFTFHYATLDSPPTLRMVSLAGDESRDYISRQATLSVKANGVYTVLGTETFMASILNNDAHGSRLCWKFDYLVGDRKVDGTGKTLPGEKTLTPLTFSCSPYLLHPLQGKKAGLMHIMKKNLVPKLGSQKLEPPTSLGALPRASRYLSTRDATSLIRSRSDATSGHYHSHSLARSPLDPGVGGGTILGVHHTPRTRRRRASSAGEDSLGCPRNEHRHGGIVEGVFMPLFR